MFWADTLLAKRQGKEIINDSFTPSGMVHMGSLKGPVIHDTLARVLKEKGTDVTFLYGFDDFDPIDGLSPDLQESHAKYLGVPIFQSPSPDGNGSFGDYFSAKMQALLDMLGVQPDTIYRTSELYKNGTFNKAIQLVLDTVSGVRKVYGDMYKKEIPETWFPLQVICPACGKLGTTKVTGWDGKEVTFSCEKSLVKWAEGCGATGKISPFDGNAKMPWKVEWAAKWWTFGVTIEGAGKDHASAGGSYDIAMKLVSDVFKSKEPMRLAYEFFLSGGKKMSSSKGLGLTGETLLDVLGPQRSRFLMIKTPPNQAVEFTPKGTNTIPDIFDAYQKSGLSQDEEVRRVFLLSQTGETERVPSVRFATLAQWVQMPNMEEEIIKEGLMDWAKYAREWIEHFAPDSEKFIVQKEIPESVKNLDSKQKEFLQALVEVVEADVAAEEIQARMYEIVKQIKIPSKDAFTAIYISLLGKDHGPKAASLIRSLDKAFVKKRFEDAVTYFSSSEEIGTSKRLTSSRSAQVIPPDIFSIDTKVKEKFPSISVGVAIIKGLKIEKINQELEEEKEKLLGEFTNLTTEQLGQYPEIISYRKLYKEMGVDWHSRRPSPEALLRRVALKKGLYSINTCVDAYNLVVMKHRVSVGAFDLDAIQFPTMLRFAKLNEEILLLGDQAPTFYKEKEIAYFDKVGGYNMDFNYRDAQRTAVQETTKNVLINVDGIYDITSAKATEVLQESCDMILKYCGGEVTFFGLETA